MSSASEAISIVIEEQISFLSKNQIYVDFSGFLGSFGGLSILIKLSFLWFVLTSVSSLFPPKIFRTIRILKTLILFIKGWTKNPLMNDWTLVSCCWNFSLQSIIGKNWNSIVIIPKTAIVICHLISLLKSKHSWRTSSVTLQLVTVSLNTAVEL